MEYSILKRKTKNKPNDGKFYYANGNDQNINTPNHLHCDLLGQSPKYGLSDVPPPIMTSKCIRKRNDVKIQSDPGEYVNEAIIEKKYNIENDYLINPEYINRPQDTDRPKDTNIEKYTKKRIKEPHSDNLISAYKVQDAVINDKGKEAYDADFLKFTFDSQVTDQSSEGYRKQEINYVHHWQPVTNRTCNIIKTNNTIVKNSTIRIGNTALRADAPEGNFNKQGFYQINNYILFGVLLIILVKVHLHLAVERSVTVGGYQLYVYLR